MQITKLELNNFSSYEGVNTFDFSVEDDKPIILIGGQNGAGKTSLFTAIKIALYGPLVFGYTGYNSYYSKKIRGLINNKAFQSKDFSSGVKIEIKQKKERAIVTYTIIRNWKIEETHIEEEASLLDLAQQHALAADATKTSNGATSKKNTEEVPENALAVARGTQRNKDGWASEFRDSKRKS